ncbi:DUF3592 domain-containing protein [Pseudonocardia sp. C8]|uniref:DUF3592 domain-containing protein n=1 Tax=Pseudonocardia sp. C8 TaxID=2762759 RepID=UPI0016433CDD|nr:DUF3592 domain-containing protein [Pseudonocardia sp. C8]MBC3194489.1 DUF3592 domain-containing protein [Pseudonocardia sp. C8]
MTAIGGVAGAFAAMGVVFVVAGLGQVLRPVLRERRARRWTPVRADVVAVRQDRRVRTGDRARSITVTVVTYRYRLPHGGPLHEAEADLSDSDIAVPGTTATVHVDPDDPTRSQYRCRGSAGHGCSGVVFVVLGAVAVCIGALLWGSAS